MNGCAPKLCKVQWLCFVPVCCLLLWLRFSEVCSATWHMWYANSRLLHAAWPHLCQWLNLESLSRKSHSHTGVKAKMATKSSPADELSSWGEKISKCNLIFYVLWYWLYGYFGFLLSWWLLWVSVILMIVVYVILSIFTLQTISIKIEIIDLGLHQKSSGWGYFKLHLVIS